MHINTSDYLPTTQASGICDFFNKFFKNITININLKILTNKIILKYFIKF